ncbi:MAG: hypothetical protein ACI4C4_07090 [Lachnospiraceae bacterium]
MAWICVLQGKHGYQNYDRQSRWLYLSEGGYSFFVEVTVCRHG